MSYEPKQDKREKFFSIAQVRREELFILRDLKENLEKDTKCVHGFCSLLGKAFVSLETERGEGLDPAREDLINDEVMNILWKNARNVTIKEHQNIKGKHWWPLKEREERKKCLERAIKELEDHESKERA